MRLELDIYELKQIIDLFIQAKYNLTTLESNFTYDLVNFDENLFGLTCTVMDKETMDEIVEEKTQELEKFKQTKETK
jgi:hypothetical protein